ncbi:putative conserved transmembrane protein [Mycobacterium kansasii]|uniref:Putative conserved transmembrane protein n=1 Tax=Mycobacterium kansasii TaxID=1768 RepID=A0A1V3WJB8_MYCKA|nr:putative conserved transmembrane protein [Mycobacterium kansasii]
MFYEPGASWYWLLAGPIAAVSMILIEMSGGGGVGLVTPAIFLVMVSVFVAVQVKAARIHTSVELTEDALRQGTETILVSEIVKVFPEPENSEASGKPLAKWQSARALGELVGVPRAGWASV